MKIKGKLIIFFVLSLLVFILSGCVEFYEHISSNKKGEVNIFFKFSFSKKFLDLANAESGEYFDYQTLISILETDNDLYSLLGFQKSTFSNENEDGYYLKGTINLLDNSLKTKVKEGGIKFIPYLENNKIIIILPSGILKMFFSDILDNEGEDEESSEDQVSEDAKEDEENAEYNDYVEEIEYIKTLFSAVKYKLTIGKNFNFSIKTVYLILNNKVKPIEIIDLFDQYLIEICFSDFIIYDQVYLVIE
ncbi:MAG: hypothetical protein GYA61_02855 [Spirochaetales bacterium]|nr:hypothetical protein [Spirochaetales bacterium]